MAQATINGQIPFPNYHNNMATFPSYASQAVAATNKVAYIIQSPVTDTITDIGFRTGVTTTGGTVDCRIETVSAGVPTGTLWGTNTNGNCVVADTDDNVWKTTTLTAGASVNRGDIYAIVLVFPTLYVGNITYYADAGIGNPGFYSNTGSRAFILNSGCNCSVKYTNNAFSPTIGLFPFSNISTITRNNTSTPDVYANKYVMDFTCTVNGCRHDLDLDGDTAIKLYDSDGVTVLASATNNLNTPVYTGVTLNFMYFTNDVTLYAGKTYWLGVEPSTATSLSAYSLDFNTSAEKEQYMCKNISYSTAKDPTGTGSRTDTANKVLYIGLLINKVDNGQGVNNYSFMS